MKSTVRWALGLGSALSLVLCARAQGQEGPAPEGGQVVMVQPGMPGMGPATVAFGGEVELLGFGGVGGGKVVKGAPFSAVSAGETKQTLADGTTITHKFQNNLYRDEEGRFRKEATLPAIGPLAASGKPHTVIMISDPVAGTTYDLNPDQKVAYKLPVHKRGLGPRKFSTGAGPGPGADVRFEAGPGGVVKYEKFGPEDNANLKKESLGTQTISGVNAEGTRYTRTIPVGQIGNDKALTIVKEEWYSPDLQMVVQSKRTDPMFGQTLYSVTSIQRNAPNANLFTVPSDYTVKEAPAKRMFIKNGRMRNGGEPPPPPADAPGGPEI
ncbi:MAG TPA: hypothetical protein VN749_14920 [Candidatus Eisenbacteria bacterium]|jgi:hypothetical protein|nr:hypothetical protein [Candidatus Eisenbacteria bacterium]